MSVAGGRCPPSAGPAARTRTGVRHQGEIIQTSMQAATRAEESAGEHPVLTRAAAEYRGPVLLALLLLLGLAVRMYRLTAPPLDFHAVRQFRSAVISHWFYIQSLPSPSEWEVEVARLNAASERFLEPPILETLAWAAYRLTGGEHLWLPRLMSSLFWLIGGLFLFLLARRISSEHAALAAVGIYLFLPFGIQASRSFQPDPLMVALLVAALWAVFRYDAKPSPSRLACATALAAAALFAKPPSLFFLYGAFGGLALRRLGFRRAIGSREIYVFGALSLLPVLLYSIYGFFAEDFLRGQAGGRFLPHLLLTLFFWIGWLNKIGQAVGYPLILVALLGAMLAPIGPPRALLLGLWAGYVLYCLFFTWHAPTHSYYHLPLVPVIALSLAPLAARVPQDRRWRAVAVAGFVAWGLASVNSAGALLSNHDGDRQQRTAQEIGELVGHSTRTILLADDDGLPLRYYGKLAGVLWNLRAEEPQAVTAEQRFQMLGLSLVGAVVVREAPGVTAEQQFRTLDDGGSREYFIVTPPNQLRQQPSLRSFLESTFPVLAQTNEYLIFDLRGRAAWHS
jgi:hypothetical protein